MAEKRDTHGKEPAPRKNEPNLPHDLNEELGAIIINEAEPAVGEAVRKHQEAPWLKKNANVLILAGAGVVSLVLLVVLGSQLGWFGSASKPQPSAVAVVQPAANPQPTAASPPAQPTAQPGPPVPAPGPQVSPAQPTPQPGQPTWAGGPQIKPLQPPPQPGQPAPSPQVPGQEPKKEAPKKPSLPDDVAKWKKGDYYRARKENDPKLVQAVVFLGQTFRGKEPAARGLIELLKPLPAEKLSAGPTPAGPAAPQPVPGPGPSLTPGSAQPPNQGDMAKLVEAIVEALGCNGSAARPRDPRTDPCGPVCHRQR